MGEPTRPLEAKSRPGTLIGDQGPTAVNLFSGADGWCALVDDLWSVGIEVDRDACRTASAAGLPVMRADVTTLNPRRFAGFEGLIASPPCTTFSTAGKGEGAGQLAAIVAAVDDVAEGRAHSIASDGMTELVLEPLRWVRDMRPVWTCWEQVPPVLPVWDACARALRSWGYSVWSGVLNSADHGVPQTRRRAFLIANRTTIVHPPVATHCDGGSSSLFGELAPWVSMAEALGWGDGLDLDRRTNSRGPRGTTVASATVPFERPAPTLDAVGLESRMVVVNTRGDRGEDPKGGNEFSADRPSWALTEKARTWVLEERQAHGVRRRADQPAPTITSSADNGNFRWCWEKPATTVAGDPRITARCHHDEGSQGADAKTTEQVRAGEYEGTEPIRLTIDEAAALQSFPPGWPWQGTRTSRFRQVGNAVPPVLGRAVIAAARGQAMEAAA